MSVAFRCAVLQSHPAAPAQLIALWPYRWESKGLRKGAPWADSSCPWDGIQGPTGILFTLTEGTCGPAPQPCGGKQRGVAPAALPKRMIRRNRACGPEGTL